MKVILCFLFVFILLTSFSQSMADHKVLIPYRIDNRWGLSDTLGNLIIQPIYSEINEFFINAGEDNASRYVVKSNNSYFVIDQNNHALLPKENEYDSIWIKAAHPDYFWVFKKGKVGLYHNSKELINCMYNRISFKENESFEIKKGKLVGLVNSKGKLIVPIEYVEIHTSYKAEDGKNEKFVWVAKGVLVEKKFYDKKTPKNNELSAVSINKMEIMNSSIDFETPDANEIRLNLEKKYDEVDDFDHFDNYVYVTLKNKKGVVRIKNEIELVEPLYDKINYFSRDNEGAIFLVLKDDKFGLVKEGNKTLLPCEFDKITRDLKNNVYLIEKNNKKGCIVFNTFYPPIYPKYKSIRNSHSIRINPKWQFSLFEVTTEGGRGYVGENGIEYFKN